jgi:glutathione S-transferase
MGHDDGEIYRLYWIPGTCARVIYVALEEIGAPYEVVLIKRQKGSPAEYLEVNPKGKVPALEVGPLVVTENPAIQTFLSRRHPEAGLLPTEGQPGIEALETASIATSRPCVSRECSATWRRPGHPSGRRRGLSSSGPSQS